MSLSTFRNWLRGKIGRIIEPIASNLLVWSRVIETRVGEVEWGREVLVERLNQADTRENALTSRIASLEEWREQAHWAREAIVERLNFIDSRDEALASTLGLLLHDMKSLQRFVAEQGTPIPAAELDAIAMRHRLAALEDHVEALLMQVESRPDRAELVSFPRPNDAEREKVVG